MYHFWLWDMLFQTAKLKDYIYSVACVIWLWVLDMTIKSSQKNHIWNSQSNLTSYTINVIFRLSCLGQLSKSFRNYTPGPMPQKSHPHKEAPSNQTQIHWLNINKFKPTINSGFLVRKHLVTKFKFIDSTLTNLSPQSIVVLLCLYKEWHHFPGYKLFVSLLSEIHHICIPAFPFDPPMQSGTYIFKSCMRLVRQCPHGFINLWPPLRYVCTSSQKSSQLCFSNPILNSIIWNTPLQLLVNALVGNYYIWFHNCIYTLTGMV